jgi:adenylosuccinate synthase
MKTAKIVVGLGFGDEGKGITTDFLARKNPESIIVRFSGGQQAAHTVIIGDRKHVHSSFASGALRGLPSYFTEHCTIHPTFLYNEKLELELKGGNVSIHIHPLAKVTTPFDVWHNKNDSKNIEHGTCGKGVGATMKRNENNYKLYAIDLISPKNFLIEKLKEIARYYGFYANPEVAIEIDEFVEIIKKIEWQINDYNYLNSYSSIIFEGSQGILLDMDHGIFPNVTYANTTSKNAYSICEKLNIKDIQIYYVTRCYGTRHGYGWMSNETELNLENNNEETCIFNQYQKKFRIGNIDYELLNYALKVDEIYSHTTIKNLIVTCLDQLPSDLKPNNLTANFNTIYGSYSPDSKDFKKIN